MAGMNFRAGLGMPNDTPLVIGGARQQTELGRGPMYYPGPASTGAGAGATAGNIPTPPRPPSQQGGSGAGGGASYMPPPLPPVGPVPVNNGNIPQVGASTETGSMMPPSAPGAGWQNMGSGGGLNDRLGNRLQRQSMNQLAAGAY